MKKHNPRGSLIGKAISDAVGQLPENDPDVDPCVVGQGGCFLSAGIEHLFVALTAKAFVDHAHANKRAYPFEQLVYAPHTSIERKCGFDLSVGLYNTPPRLRLMHKIIYAKKASDPWCDESWHWRSLDITAKKDLTHEHFGKIVRAHTEHPFLQPFLVIHVCYCVHEYRRMGQQVGGVAIPGFDHQDRTLVIDLSKIKDVNDYETHLKSKEYGIVVSRDAAKAEITAQLVGPKPAVALTVYPFSELLKRFLKTTPIKA